MSTSTDPIPNALAHHQAGRLDEAARIYEQVLAANPRHAGALHLLGLVALQTGQFETAVDRIRRAIDIDAKPAAFHANLAEAYRSLRRPSEAEAAYRAALERNPSLIEAHFGLGTLLEQQSQPAEAAKHYEAATSARPDYLPAYIRLGAVCQALDRLDGAAAVLARAVALNPRDLEARFTLAGVLLAQQKYADAEAQYRAALAVDPQFVEAINGLGALAQAQHRHAEAIVHYAEALRLRPDYYEAHYNWGTALAAQGLQTEAITKYRDAIARRPDSADAYCRLGTSLQRLGQLEEAAAAYEQTLRLRPRDVAARCNLGTVLHEQGHTERAIECFEMALQADPNTAGTYNNLGNALQHIGQQERAEECFAQALELAPDFPDAHYNRSLLYLAREQFAEGWTEYAWRLKCKHIPVRPFAQPLWQGEPLAGRTLLLHAEQGYGDTLHMLRYVAKAQQCGGRVVLELPSPLVTLARASGLDPVIAAGGELPPCDVHAPLLSLPGIFHADAANLADGVPYLVADEAQVAHWHDALSEITGLRVGIAWQGNPQYQRDRTRSIPLANFAPLASVPGVQLLSLQRGYGKEQLADATFAITDLGAILEARGNEFLDTAALLKNLHLVITSDTAIAHLAGGMGVPCWIALAHFADWRWFLAREDSPWYPSVRLFRQATAGDWPSVFARIATELARRASPEKL